MTVENAKKGLDIMIKSFEERVARMESYTPAEKDSFTNEGIRETMELMDKFANNMKDITKEQLDTLKKIRAQLD